MAETKQDEKMSQGRPEGLLSNLRPNYKSKSAVCPFFSFTVRDSVGCEGVLDDVHKTIIMFTSVEKRDMFMGCFCSNMDGYEGCPVYEAIYKKYKER